MQNDFLVRVQPKITMLEQAQKEAIHGASLEVLQRTGVLVDDDEALGLLKDAGCWVKNENLVHIPASVVEDAVHSVPKQIIVSNRDGAVAMRLTGRNAYYGSGSDTINVIDLDTGERRLATLEDVRRAARLADGLKNYDFVMSMSTATDMPPDLSDRHQFATMVANTTKPIMFTAWNRDNLEDIYRMAVAVAGSEEALRLNPFLILYNEPIAPFLHPKDSLQKLLFCADKGLPVEYHCISMATATAPATLSGAFVQANARMLSGMVIHQLKRRGAPLIVQSPIIHLDMRTSLMPYFGPEWVLGALMSKEMALYYGVPTFGKAGATDSKALDQQAGIEYGMSILAESLIGNNLIHDNGYLESGMTSSLAGMAMCNEVMSHVRHILKGIDMSPEHFAIEQIVQAGPKGNFMTMKHTLKHFRQEAWFSGLIDHSTYPAWIAGGSTTMLDRATRAAQNLLASHEVAELPVEVQGEIDAILKRAASRLHAA